MKTSTLLYSLFALLLCVSCGKEEAELVAQYEAIYKMVKEDKHEQLISELDDASNDFLAFVTDTNNLTYPKMKAFGKKHKLLLFTTVYNHQFGSNIKLAKDKKKRFLTYLALTGVPMFSWLQQPRLLKDQTQTGKENYVVVATRINKNTSISSKIKFTENVYGQKKLDLLSLLRLREKILQQTYKNFVRTSRELEIGDDRILRFLENMEKPEYRLNEIQYDPTVKSH